MSPAAVRDFCEKLGYRSHPHPRRCGNDIINFLDDLGISATQSLGQVNFSKGCRRFSVRTMSECRKVLGYQ